MLVSGGLTDGADLLSDLIRESLVEVLELHTQTKISQLDRVIGEKDVGS